MRLNALLLVQVVSSYLASENEFTSTVNNGCIDLTRLSQMQYAPANQTRASAPLPCTFVPASDFLHNLRQQHIYRLINPHPQAKENAFGALLGLEANLALLLFVA
jgi:hypothetical protein